MRIRPGHVLLLWAITLGSSCSGHLFSSRLSPPDRSRPIVRVELRNAADRIGASTTEGLLFLADPTIKGACRVHYFLGPDVLVEDGTVVPFGGVYACADIDLKAPSVPVLMRELTREDELVALLWNGNEVERIAVELADPPVEGYVLKWPDRDLPVGTPIFCVRTGKFEGELDFVGLADAQATLTTGGRAARFVTFTGPARMREALAVPRPLFTKQRVIHRPDGISVRK